MERCENFSRYAGKAPPMCGSGDGCESCWKKFSEEEAKRRRVQRRRAAARERVGFEPPNED
jgi:hypothetical protein